MTEKYGSPEFYKLLERMSEIHNKKSHDYASNDDPFGNYHFAGELSKLFNNPKDAGFVGRIGEKLYRLANLENSGKSPLNETIEDTETDICVIVALWITSRRERRKADICGYCSTEINPEDRILMFRDKYFCSPACAAFYKNMIRKLENSDARS